MGKAQSMEEATGLLYIHVTSRTLTQIGGTSNKDCAGGYTTFGVSGRRYGYWHLNKPLRK